MRRSRFARLAVAALLATGILGTAVSAAAEPSPGPAPEVAEPSPGPAPEVAEPRIIGGEAVTTPYSFFASIIHPDSTGWNVRHTCGGSLVHREWVLTAGHCGDRFVPGVTQVRVGSTDWTTGGELRRVRSVVIHPLWAYQPGNDLAMLRLDKPVAAKPIHIAPLLGPVGLQHRIIGHGTTCEATDPAFPCRPQQLYHTVVRRAPDPFCDWFDASLEACVQGDTGQMACYGDSGGPMVVYALGMPLLVGATSRDGDPPIGDPEAPINFTCGRQPPGGPQGLGVYTDVTVYRSWVHHVIKTGTAVPVR